VTRHQALIFAGAIILVFGWGYAAVLEQKRTEQEAVHQARVDDAIAGNVRLRIFLAQSKARENGLDQIAASYRKRLLAASRTIDSLRGAQAARRAILDTTAIDSVAGLIGLRLVDTGTWGTDSIGVRRLAARLTDGDFGVQLAAQLQAQLAVKDSNSMVDQETIVLLRAQRDSLTIAVERADSSLRDDRRLHRPGCRILGLVPAPCISPIAAAVAGAVVGAGIAATLHLVVPNPVAIRGGVGGFERTVLRVGSGQDDEHLPVAAVAAHP